MAERGGGKAPSGGPTGDAPASAARRGDSAREPTFTRPDSVSALERGFAVLHCFQPGVPALAHQQIARMTGLPKATVSRVTQTLLKLGYLDASHEDGRFRLTAKTLSIGHVYLANVDIRAIAQPLMRQLADESKGTVNLVVRSGDHMVVVETVRSDAAAVSIISRIGFQFPVLQTAIGRAYLAGLDDAERARMVRSLRSTVAAHEWKAAQDSARRAVDEYQAQGFCAVWGEWRSGVHSAATTIRDGSQGELYVINCAGPAAHLEREHVARVVGPRLVEIARHIEQTTNVSWRQS